ncbi:MAG: Mut7-C RNAse domain-containing protein [Thermotogae bacterium]|nr:Mut7-C RNAse domain-containing protein [Thermotogota bacterium]
MKFLADRMLGKLAKKLRILGFDTLYFREAAEEEILQRVRQEGRILLTKDRDLLYKALKAGLDVYGIKSDKWRSQLLAVLKRFRISPGSLEPFSRCIECNAKLEKVDKSQIESLVPEYVYRTQESFYRCPACGRIYWAGSHVEKMKDLLKELRLSVDERVEKDVGKL